MKLAGVAAKQKKKFKATTDSKHNLPVAPNLLNRQFEVKEPDTVYVSDITYSDFGPMKAGYIWPWPLIFSHAKLWAGH
ncbi:MAG: hypothetical protein L6365_15315 [Desulfobulbaceae bacterium]|nr:hypothetical protein [Desulfobulbaceae bacterium]